MDLNDYFDPVALSRPSGIEVDDNNSFGKNIRINTASNPVSSISEYQIAIMGVSSFNEEELQESYIKVADQIRMKLYPLFKAGEKQRIIDLGNLKVSTTPSGACFGLRDIVAELIDNNITVVVLSDRQDYFFGAYMAVEKIMNNINLVSIDSGMSIRNYSEDSPGWLQQVLAGPHLLNFTNLGYQQYFVNRKYIRLLEERYFNSLRLGIIRSDLTMAEPVLRDAHLISLDFSAIRHADAPGVSFPSPNGFTAEEACQIAKYAGLSDNLRCFGISGIDINNDLHGQTAHLAAQAIWYFIEGLLQRKTEEPAAGNSDFKVFVVSHQDMEHELTFYKSLITNRWWMEVPVMQSNDYVLVSCSVEDYNQACRHEIPDMWWQAFQRIN